MSRPLSAKLLIKPGAAVCAEPVAVQALIGPLPDGARTGALLARADVALLAVSSRADVEALLARHGEALRGPAVLWLLYPKGGRADINRDSLWPLIADAVAMRPITQVSVDETWSALRFRPLTEAEAAGRA